MADIQKAVECVMREEDSTLSGEITDTRGDRGGKTRFGISSKWHPELLAGGFFSTMPTADALKIAEELMATRYAAPLMIASITDIGVACKLLSFGVNVGMQMAVRRMQVAVNTVYPMVIGVRVTGLMDADTLAAMNHCMPQSLLNSFRLRMIGYYVSICRANVSQREFLCGWIDRALA